MRFVRGYDTWLTRRDLAPSTRGLSSHLGWAWERKMNLHLREDDSLCGNDDLAALLQLLMGFYAAAFATNMNIGAMQLYNRALSSQEVIKNFNAYRGRYGF